MILYAPPVWHVRPTAQVVARAVEALKRLEKSGLLIAPVRAWHVYPLGMTVHMDGGWTATVQFPREVPEEILILADGAYIHSVVPKSPPHPDRRPACPWSSHSSPPVS